MAKKKSKKRVHVTADDPKDDGKARICEDFLNFVVDKIEAGYGIRVERVFPVDIIFSDIVPVIWKDLSDL